ncbi:LysR family transcriptional regulator [Demequina capsici]|uniref:LysR family transcriptional regulator n=1 Tax=Demequina capsici TaxID=3075620 RepID=A0AA96JBJ1_9MICO|nr:LysR family transcriptional regulator [Demequina sp. PMTSA13]WNM28485.1 LysR family transcriptional regulator [Demequina sp. PMTSA13]
MDVAIPTLRYFTVLAAELHFGRAAERLSISSPSLSQQISGLERSIGGQLFERTSRSVTLTALGAAFLPHATKVVEAHDELCEWVERRRVATGPTLRIGVVAAGAAPLTAAIMSAVGSIPDLGLEMRRVGFFDVVGELLNDRADVVLAAAPLPHDPATVEASPLWTEPRVLVVPAGHPLADRSSIEIAETAGETFVAASGADPQALAWWVVDPRPDGSHPRIGARADDIEGILDLVEAGMGVNIAAASAATHFPRSTLAFVPVRDIEPATVLLCTRAQRSPIAETFVRIAQTEARRAWAAGGMLADR